MSVSNQYFLAAEHVSSAFAFGSRDGILGLGYLQTTDEPSFIQNAKAQGAIKSAEFGLKLSAVDSELYIARLLKRNTSRVISPVLAANSPHAPGSLHPRVRQ